MKNPGHPTSTSPSWYHDRGPSHIEDEFSKATSDLAGLIEREHWFGDAEKHHRYRVDFILKDARLIIELDGHASHSTREQLEKDAVRQRYLSRAGYTVIRFTGREIISDVQGCVSEVRQMYEECMQRAPAKYRVMYVDYSFVTTQMIEALNFYRGIHPEKELTFQPLEKIIPHAIEWLHEKSFITVFVFCPENLHGEIGHLNTTVMDYAKGEIRFNTLASDLYSLDLGDHLESFAHLFDEFMVVADDPVYRGPIRAVLPAKLSERTIGTYTHRYLANAKLLRLGNDETSFAGTELACVLWQDIWYVIGTAFGLNEYEL
ncbi:endonuclease domain-containing protein [Pseudomonas aeruginosa]|uniref:endonuclease domain-containing protein n=1 Tax=Pseudomonas aeruginosa TaxID=287 RepID=UPI000EAB5D28|nr:DUF559 domain-containing protein [Pseudomonas aeruginosa]HCT7102235.1 DUF559 domain-containing protein [Pseudomonas aeruginosa]HEN8507925.1 DUF559 domain-containing protein [Pseudomonas aeruginosa]HEN8756348.1 DUF559 domain-containing protein [Pseudomonas aeruginosa]HEN8806119.1 DUF559 domain-containing protein [Pseudomonas aeruginosa]